MPINPPHYCANHLLPKLSDLGVDPKKQFNKEYRKLLTRYFEAVSIDIQKVHKYYLITYRGPESLLDHGARHTLKIQPPAGLLDMPRIMRRVESGEVVTLSKQTIKNLQMHRPFADEVFKNVIFELATSQSLGTFFLTERPLHIEILNSLSADPALEQRNHIVQKHLTSFVPFVDGVSCSDLIKLRNREEEAFISYRQMLNKAIDECKKQKEHFTERDARAIYSDVIAPQLAVLNSKVKSAKKDLSKAVIRKTLSWSAAITFGIYAGIVPEALVAAAQALGLTKVLVELSELLISRTDGEQTIRNEGMYFLWKVKQRAQG